MHVAWKAMQGHLWKIDEIAILEQAYPAIEPYLSEEGKAAIKKQGVWVYDQEGEKGSPTIGDNRECAYALYDEKGILKCGMEAGSSRWKDQLQKAD